jgi:hypothetical protein
MKIRASLLFILSLFFCASCNAQNNGSFATLKLEGANASIQIRRVHIHAFLAEYDRYLILNVNGKPVVEVQISTDTGGYSRANVFSTNLGSTLIVQDRMGRYEIDVESQKIKELDGNDCANPKDSNFIGAFDTDESKKWQFIPASKRKQMPMLVSGCRNEI